MLYWAYGSNLNPVGMRNRCPRAKRVGPLTLDNGALVFRGVADVVYREGSTVPGGVWRITKECEWSLDRYEGVANNFYRKKYIQLQVNGVKETCLYYQMTMRKGVMPPSELYLNTIVKGYEYFGLDTGFLNKALEESWHDKRVTEHLRIRHDRKGRPNLAKEIDLSACGPSRTDQSTSITGKGRMK